MIAQARGAPREQEAGPALLVVHQGEGDGGGRQIRVRRRLPREARQVATHPLAQGVVEEFGGGHHRA